MRPWLTKSLSPKANTLLGLLAAIEIAIAGFFWALKGLVEKMASEKQIAVPPDVRTSLAACRGFLDCHGSSKGQVSLLLRTINQKRKL